MKQRLKFKLITMCLTGVFLFSMNSSNAQFVITSKFRPRTYEEALLKATIEQKTKARYEEYVEIAYNYYNAGDYQNFIYYSNEALKTGWYNRKLFYDRGTVYEYAKQYNDALFEYRKSKRKGYAPAEEAIKRCKEKRKNEYK